MTRKKGFTSRKGTRQGSDGQKRGETSQSTTKVPTFEESMEDEPSSDPQVHEPQKRQQRLLNGRFSAEKPEGKYCLCGEGSWGTMIACDNEDCGKEWFHLTCVALEEPPPRGTKWYCPDCREGHKDIGEGRAVQSSFDDEPSSVPQGDEEAMTSSPLPGGRNTSPSSSDGAAHFSYVDEATWAMNHASPLAFEDREPLLRFPAVETDERGGDFLTASPEPITLEARRRKEPLSSVVVSDPANTLSLSNSRVLRKSTLEKGKERLITSPQPEPEGFESNPGQAAGSKRKAKASKSAVFAEYTSHSRANDGDHVEPPLKSPKKGRNARRG